MLSASLLFSSERDGSYALNRQEVHGLGCSMLADPFSVISLGLCPQVFADDTICHHLVSAAGCDLRYPEQSVPAAIVPRDGDVRLRGNGR
jgi:hypothetical protein